MKHSRWFGLAFMGLAACGGSDSKDDTPATPTTAVTFADVTTVLEARCGSTSCHAADATSTSSDKYNKAGGKIYLGRESVFKADKDNITTRVITKKDMPPSNASATQKQITSAEKDVITKFLAQ